MFKGHKNILNQEKDKLTNLSYYEKFVYAVYACKKMHSFALRIKFTIFCNLHLKMICFKTSKFKYFKFLSLIYVMHKFYKNNLCDAQHLIKNL